jgi:putative tryptophan/tyrosine transport system substrate-binding protein
VIFFAALQAEQMASSIGRRQFISALGVATAWPPALRAQPAGKLPTIGFLGASSPTSWRQYVDAFAQRLRELGWIDGRTVTIDYRWAEGNQNRYSDIAEAFVQSKVDVIVTSGSAVREVMQVTSTIPIVFAVAVDPLGSHFVASLAHPGGNVTGLSIQSTDIGPKRLELLREADPKVSRLAILANVGYSAAASEMAEIRTAAVKAGFEVDTLEVRRADEIESALNNRGGGGEALYVCNDSLIVSNASRIVALAMADMMPTMAANRGWSEEGALLSYGPNETHLFGHAADLVDKILRGAKPADIPVEQPTKFELIVNLKTAKSLGLTIPPTMLALADEVIE